MLSLSAAEQGLVFFATKLAEAEWGSGKLFVGNGELRLCLCVYAHMCVSLLSVLLEMKCMDFCMSVSVRFY